MEWRQVRNSDDSEAIFGAFKVADLLEASIKANEAVKIIRSHRDDSHSHIALSHEGLSIMLHGISKAEITAKDWVIAEEIRQALDG